MLCVIAKLDSHATEKLRTLQKVAASYEAVPSALYGHITIAAYTPENDMDFVIECKELLQGVGPFSVLFDKVEVLSETSIIVATPQKNGVLLTLHTKIAERYGPFLDQWTCGDNWYPHTTLLYNPQADLPRICRAVQEDFSPFEAGVKSIEFSRVTETGYEIVDRIVL
jgi:hypothetical protein